MRTSVVGALFLVSLIAGCGEPPLFPVTGQVMVDGTPAAGVNIGFHPATDRRKARATQLGIGFTDQNGNFEIRSAGKEGLEAGDYVVTFGRLMVAGRPQAVTERSDRAVESLAEQYLDPDTTPERKTITGSTSNLVFNLSSRKQAFVRKGAPP